MKLPELSFGSVCVADLDNVIINKSQLFKTHFIYIKDFPLNE